MERVFFGMGDVEKAAEGSGSSECSSGCESGWTMYLNHSTDDGFVKDGRKCRLQEVEEAEDLSMISDASSGPPHFRGHDEFFCPALVKKDGIRKIVDMQYRKQREKESYGFLDDTASSPLVATNQPLAVDDNIVEMSHGFSATHFKSCLQQSC